MASSAPASRLTEAHRLAQARLGAQTVLRIRAAWAVLDPTDLAGSSGPWLRVAIPIVQAHHNISSHLAANYVRAFRQVEFGTDSGFEPVLSLGADPRAVATSLMVTGPVTIRRHTGQGEALAEVIDLAQARTARAAMRHALNGGRQTLLDSVERDEKAIGWARVTSGRPCAFCALLASRGPVYGRHTAGFKAHDSCHCTAEPVYFRGARWPGRSREFRTLYDRVAKGDPDPLNAFRRAVEA